MDFKRTLSFSDIPFLKDGENRHYLAQSASYCAALFLFLPVLVGGLLPEILYCDTDPGETWWMRLIQLVASSGISAAFVWIPTLFLIRWKRIRSLYLSMLLPVALTVQATQVIFFRAFGSQIDERILGLFQENFSALWRFASTEYHIEWVIGLAAVISAAMAWSIHRRANWFPRAGVRSSVAMVLTVIFAATISQALLLNVEGTSSYSSAKLAEAPLYRVALFARSVFSEKSNPDVSTVLARSGEIEAATPCEEIERRLGAKPADHITQEVSRPAWLKQQPKHVFCFILESFEQDFINLPEMESIAPRLRQFSREGIATSRMISASGATIDAVHASMAGVTAEFRYPGTRALEQYSLDTLPRLMLRAGYHPTFYAGSHRKFGGKGDACEAYGFESFTGCPDVASNIPSNEWGVDDASFFEWARGEIQKSPATPRFVTFLNVSNHPPFSAPVDDLWSDSEIPDEVVKRFVGGDRKEKCRYAKHVRFADLEFGKMVDWLDATYPGSLFVFYGDHCGSRFRRDHDHHVPFILWGDEVIDASVDTSRWFGAQMDIPATLANLILPEGEKFQSLGRPVWDADPTRVSVGSELVISGEANPVADGDCVRITRLIRDESAEDDSSETSLRLRGSAIRALSWSYLNHRPLGNELPVHNLAGLAKP